MGLGGFQPSFCRYIHRNFCKIKGKADQDRIKNDGRKSGILQETFGRLCFRFFPKFRWGCGCCREVYKKLGQVFYTSFFAFRLFKRFQNRGCWGKRQHSRQTILSFGLFRSAHDPFSRIRAELHENRKPYSFSSSLAGQGSPQSLQFPSQTQEKCSPQEGQTTSSGSSSSVK